MYKKYAIIFNSISFLLILVIVILLCYTILELVILSATDYVNWIELTVYCVLLWILCKNKYLAYL